MAKIKQIDLSKIKTYSIKSRKSKVRQKDFAKVFDPKRQNFAGFVKSFPDILAAKELLEFADDFVKAVHNNRPRIFLIGAHVIKVGLSPLLVDLIKNKTITCIGMNSAAAIHDVESTLFGKTSEDVAKNIINGKFGMARETGEFINGTLKNSVSEDIGYGSALGRELIRKKAKNIKNSILATCYKNNIPVTIHAAIGTDIIHQQPTMDGAVTGEMSFRDFKIFCNVLKDLNGGVVLNIGSAVILPEVFLKALTVVRNLGYNVKKFSTANFDMIPQYRPFMNIVTRPTQQGGKGYNFIGHHEIMIPLFIAIIKQKMK
ncbi:MAG: hypothetical protein IGBAC_1172 [Ignavibacteriae bacterium]|nr:MAG: hypothetical protein IGBAC_1172 [Ignavibacteriota bacterium]